MRCFQSPHGDFGFLKRAMAIALRLLTIRLLSIPSRGFWFFEAAGTVRQRHRAGGVRFQSPHGDFGFLKSTTSTTALQAAISCSLRGEVLLT